LPVSAKYPPVPQQSPVLVARVGGSFHILRYLSLKPITAPSPLVTRIRRRSFGVMLTGGARAPAFSAQGVPALIGLFGRRRAAECCWHATGDATARIVVVARFGSSP
jgi:hypothetical protein